MTTEPSSRRRRAVVLISAACLASAAASTRLPHPTAVHWDNHGTPNGWASPLIAAAVVPLVMIFIALVTFALPTQAFARRRVVRAGGEHAAGTAGDQEVDALPAARRAYDLVVVLILGAMLVIHVLLLLVGIGQVRAAHLPRIITVVLSVMLLLIGNYMPRVNRPTAFIGIRFPWLKNNPSAWAATQRLAGYGFVSVGLIGLLASLIIPTDALPILIVAVGGVVAALALYSYVSTSPPRTRRDEP